MTTQMRQLSMRPNTDSLGCSPNGMDDYICAKFNKDHRKIAINAKLFYKHYEYKTFILI